MSDKKRCVWVPADDALYTAYHDDEWGVPIYDSQQLFEMLLLEGAQAGLSWITILKKRENYRAAFDGFDPAIIALYDSRKVAQLMKNEGIVRNRLKIDAAIGNAKAFLKLEKYLQTEESSFSDFLWSFVGGEPVISHWASWQDIPAKTVESSAMAKALQQRGFKFVGPTICYAFMQAVGMVNDHEVGCLCHPDNIARMTATSK